MFEPDPKKVKLSTEGREIFTFTKENEVWDRILLVKNSIFHVHSATLIEHFDYFRVMFTSDFIEKDKNEIEIKGVEVEEMKMFLSALFNPENISSKDINVSLLCKVFTFYQATDYLLHFLEEKKAYALVTAREWFELSVEHVIPEIKDRVEKVLIKQFVKKFPIVTEKTDEEIDFEFEDFFIKSLDLISEFGLHNLKKTLEARLSADYSRSSHLVQVEKKYVQLIRKYELEDLKKVVELYAINHFHRFPQMCRDLLFRYVETAKPVQFRDLKAQLEKFHINTINETLPEFIPYEYSLQQADRYEMFTVKDHIETVLLNSLRKEDSNGITIWKDIKARTTKEGFQGVVHNDNAVQQLTKIIKLAYDFNLVNLKRHIEELLLNGLSILTSCNQDLFLVLTRYSDSPKAQVEQFLLDRFNNEVINFKAFQYSQFLKNCEMFRLEQLKTHIEDNLIAEFSENKNIERFDRLTTHRMPKLKKAIEEFLITLFDNVEIFDDKTIQHFFDYLLEHELTDFKGTVTDFLQTVPLDDPVMQENYMIKLPKEQKDIIDAMLRKPVEEE